MSEPIPGRPSAGPARPCSGTAAHPDLSWCLLGHVIVPFDDGGAILSGEPIRERRLAAAVTA